MTPGMIKPSWIINLAIIPQSTQTAENAAQPEKGAKGPFLDLAQSVAGKTANRLNSSIRVNRFLIGDQLFDLLQTETAGSAEFLPR